VLKPCGVLSLDEVEQSVHSCLEHKDLDGALDAIKAAVDSIINNQRSVARVYASRRLDGLCELVAKTMRHAPPFGADKQSQDGGTVILATELAAAGGHVEVIRDLVRLGSTPAPMQLFLTDSFQRIDEAAQQGYAASMGVPVSIAKKDGSGARMRETLAYLTSQRPHTVVVLAHNQDSVSIVTALACRAMRVVFVHHGDHHLSLGVTCPSFEHVDLSNFAFFNCRHALGLTNNRFWPLTLASEKALRHDGTFLREGHAVTCCVGRPEKFDDPSYQHQYQDLIGLILQSTGGRHVHIGPLSDEQLQRMQRSLQTHGIEASRLTHIPWVPSVSRALIEHGVDLYMTSFPYGGGKAQVEAMATGLPVLVHKNYRSRFLSGIDIGYPGTMAWADAAELQGILSNLTVELMHEHAAVSRAHFESHHSEEALSKAMRAKSTSEADVPPLAEVHDDGLQAFLDEERIIDSTEASHEMRQLQHQLNLQSMEIRILRKKARFLGSARYNITTAWKALLK
jgi:glycosyltransferase involved in cell wall biosynthesis